MRWRSTAHHPAVRHEHMARVHTTDRNKHGKISVCAIAEAFGKERFFANFSGRLVVSRFGGGKRQGALTVGNMAANGVLELRDRLVDGKRVRNVLGALNTQRVGAEAVNGSQTEASAGLDSRCGFVAAYFSSRRVQLVSSALPSAFAPSAPTSLRSRL